MREHLKAAAALAAFLCLGAGPAEEPVSYRLAPVFAGPELSRLAVEVRLRGDADGETRLELPGKWAGTDELWTHLENLRVEGASAVRDDGPSARLVRHAPGAPLVVRYDVKSGYASDPDENFSKARPTVRPDWFFFHGEGVFVRPVNSEARPARFAWGPLPAGWKAASDLDHMVSGGGTVGDVIESVALGGRDLTVLSRDVNGAPLRMAIRGDGWSFQPQALAESIWRVAEAQNAFWGDPGRRYFVPVAPLRSSEPGRYSVHGTGRSDGFAIAGTTNFQPETQRRFLAHEFMHTWISRQLGDLPAKDEALHYWFSEGFTDFYGDRTLLGSGLWTLEEYLQAQNERLKRYGTSPVKTATNADILKGFWSDPALDQLPYDRGALFAQLLDHRLRSRSSVKSSLDDVLHAQRKRAAANARAGVRTPAAELFQQVLREQARFNASDLVRRHIEGGEPIVLPIDAFGECARLETVTQPVFDAGFDVPGTRQAGGVITGVKPGHPAYAAGLRDGMRLVRVEAGSPRDSSVEAALRVSDASGERVIRFQPTGRETVTLQRVVMVEGLTPAQRASCTAYLAGQAARSRI